MTRLATATSLCNATVSHIVIVQSIARSGQAVHVASDNGDNSRVGPRGLISLGLNGSATCIPSLTAFVNFTPSGPITISILSWIFRVLCPQIDSLALTPRIEPILSGPSLHAARPYLGLQVACERVYSSPPSVPAGGLQFQSKMQENMHTVSDFSGALKNIRLNYQVAYLNVSQIYTREGVREAVDMRRAPESA